MLLNWALVDVYGQLPAPLLYPLRKSPRTHLIGGWVGPRAGLDAVVKRKLPVSAGNQIPLVHPVGYSLY